MGRWLKTGKMTSNPLGELVMDRVIKKYMAL